MKYINKFETTESFETAKEELNKLKHFVAYDAESKKVYLKKKFINPIVKPSESSPCDVCLYDKTNDKLIIVKGDMWNIETYPSSKYSPVGVVLIPGTHDVYGDGSCCVMSLKEMNCTTPDDGSTSYQDIYWGGYDTDIPSLANYNQVCYVGSDGVVNETVQGVATSIYLPSDRFSTVKNPYDTDTSYRFNTNKYIPSPYNNDDTRNTEYYRTSSPSSSANAMSDFNGKENTKIITDLATAQSDWKTAATITNYHDRGDYPPACCCWRYHTEGTKQGDWYLPSCGELGYIMPKFNKINEAITKLINGYGSNFGVVLHSNYYYWSSSECDRYSSRVVHTGNGFVNFSFRNYGNYVRACVRVR